MPPSTPSLTSIFTIPFFCKTQGKIWPPVNRHMPKTIFKLFGINDFFSSLTMLLKAMFTCLI